MGRRMLAAAGCLVSTGLLGGCLFAYDAAPPSMTYNNLLDEDVVVSLEGVDSPFEEAVGPHHEGIFEERVFEQDECLGTAIVVETEGGDLIGRVEEPLCKDMTLTINEDGTLTYAERTGEVPPGTMSASSGPTSG